MPVFQFKCDSCASIFEYLFRPNLDFDLDCVSCGAKSVKRVQQTYFYPNKNFCPHDKSLEPESLQGTLATIMKDESQRCGGCGTDGAPGSCKTSGGGGGCGSGKCGTCSCGKGG